VNASDKEKRERSLAPLVVGLVVACAVLLVVVIVLALLYFRSREPADGTPTAAVARPTEAATGTPPPTPGEDDLAAIIPATTKVLSGITIDKLISISEDGSVYAFSEMTPELEALAAGDVIAGEAWEQTPYGFLRKVTGVTVEGQRVVVRTDQARLEDAIEQGVVHASQELVPGDVRAGTQLPGVELAYAGPGLSPHASGFLVELDEVVLLDLDGNLETTDDQVRANGQLSFRPRFDFELRLRGYRIERLSAVSGATEHVDLSITAEMQLLDVHEEVQVAYYLLQPITVWVGWLPVVFTPVLTVDVGLDGSAVVGFDVGVTQEANLDVGLVYANGGWSPISEFTNDFAFTPPTITASCNARGYAGLQLAILIYGVGGPQGQIDGFLELDADLNRVPWWELHGGLGATVGVRFEVLGYRLADFEKRVLDQRFPLSDGGARPTDVPPTAEPPPTEPPPTGEPTPTATATATATPTLTPTPWPTPDCNFDAGGDFSELWQTYKGPLGCPLYPTPMAIQDAEQVFDNGRMLWREDNRHIYVVYEQGALSGTYQVFLDEWEEGDPEYSCAGTPPADRLQPKRGFGLVWCKLGGPAAAIGWGLEEEAGYWPGKGDPLAHDFGSGVIFRDSAGLASGMAYVLFGSTGTFVHVTY
jgi:hypothetical protein